MGFVPAQAPTWHESLCVHALPSLHDAPFVFAGFEHVPFAGLHTPMSWHWSLAAQTTGVPPTQAPALHVSNWVHALPSLHEAPSIFAGFEQTPVPGLQIPASWHPSRGEHTTAAPTHAPA